MFESIVSPLISDPFLPLELGIKKLAFKLDNLQPGGSFKIRGIGHLVEKNVKSNPNLKILVSSSGGNAGIAATLSAKRFNLEVFVFVPTTTPQSTIQDMERRGAQIIVYGSVWDESHQEAMKYLNSLEFGTALYVHPFDDITIWDGHASIIAEVANQSMGELPSIIVCAVGGGGLLAGFYFQRPK